MSLVRHMNESYRERGSKGKEGERAVITGIPLALLWGQGDKCDQVGSRDSLFFRELTPAHGGLQEKEG